MRKMKPILILICILLTIELIPQVLADNPVPTGAVKLGYTSQVLINGPITNSGGTSSGQWGSNNRYYLDFTSNNGNQLHAILEFYFMSSSLNGGDDYYVIHILSKTTPGSDTGWRLDSSGVGDSNGPANKVDARMKSGAGIIDWQYSTPYSYMNYEKDKIMTVTETYGVSGGVEYSYTVCADTLCVSGPKGTLNANYQITNTYTVTLYKWEVQPYSGSDYFQWLLGLKKHEQTAERQEAIGEYFLVVTTPAGKQKSTIQLDSITFSGNLWYSWNGLATNWDNIWMKLPSINFNYYASPQNDAGTGGDAGNSFSTATLISPGGYSGGIYTSIDSEDWYQFYAASTYKISVTVTPPSNAIYNLELYNPSGTLWAGTYPGSNGQPASVSITACTSGYWRSRIFNTGVSGHGDGIYSLSVSVTSGGSCGGGGGSIMAGTQVLMSDGSQTPVQNLASGMVISGYDPASRSFYNATITSVVAKNVNNLYVIDTSNGNPIRVDYYENFWVQLPSGQQQWMHAGEVQLGYKIFMPTTGTWAKVNTIETDTGNYTVYDLIITPTLPGGPMPVIANGYLDMK